MGIQFQVHNNRKLILPGYAGYPQTKASIPQLQQHRVSYDCKLTHYLPDLAAGGSSKQFILKNKQKKVKIRGSFAGNTVESTDCPSDGEKLQHADEWMKLKVASQCRSNRDSRRL